MDAGLVAELDWGVRSRGRTANSDGWRGNAHAIAASHQDAILGSAQVRDAHREPNPNCRQRDVYIVQPLVPPTQEHLMELLLMINAARGASAWSFHL